VLIGNTDVEDALQRLDNLTDEETRIASVELRRATHNLGEGVQGVGRDVEDVLDTVEYVNLGLRGVGHGVQDIDHMLQSVRDNVNRANRQHFSRLLSLLLYLILYNLAGNLLRDGLRNWLSPPNPSTNHNALCNAHLTGTTDWFTCGTIFKEWKSAGSLLWIHGNREFLLEFSMRSVLTISNPIAGSGKSVLWFVLSSYFRLVGLEWLYSSAIIQDLMELRKSGTTSVGYFYCDFRDDDKQSRRNLLHCLLIQLSARCESRCNILSDLYNTHDRGVHKPDDRAMIKCLKKMLIVPSHSPTYIVLDALDECPNTSGTPSPRKQVLDLVKELVGFRLPNVHICVTSRPEVDIQDVFQRLALHQVSLHNESGQKQAIIDYVAYVVNSDENMRRWRKEDKDLVIKTLSEKADGM
jgi:hypothetical protein